MTRAASVAGENAICSTVETHVTSIMAKLDLAHREVDDHRRVLVVLAYLTSRGAT